jgi:hypothetical protein
VLAVLIGLGGAFLIRSLLDAHHLGAVQAAARETAMLQGDSGRDLETDDTPVQSRLIVPAGQTEVQRGDSVVVVYRIDKRPLQTPKSGEEPNIANEKNGHLTPILTAADCTVTAQTRALTKATSVMPPGLVWQWSIDDCKTVGYKAIQLLVTFDGSGGTSDPIADRELTFVQFTDPFSLADAATAIGIAATILAALATLRKLLGSHEAEQ